MPQTGVRGETYAYCYLRRLGYIFIARNYMPSHAKGELDLLGFDADTLAVVEVRTRLARKDPSRLAGNEHYEREARSAGARGALFSAKAAHPEMPAPFRCGSHRKYSRSTACRAPAQSRFQSGSPSAIPIETA